MATKSSVASAAASAVKSAAATVAKASAPTVKATASPQTILPATGGGSYSSPSVVKTTGASSASPTAPTITQPITTTTAGVTTTPKVTYSPAEMAAIGKSGFSIVKAKVLAGKELTVTEKGILARETAGLGTPASKAYGTTAGATIDYSNPQSIQDFNNNINQQENQNQKTEADKITNEMGNVDLKTSDQVISQLTELLNPSTPEIKPQTLVEQFTDLKTKFDQDPDTVALAQQDMAIEQLKADWESTQEGEQLLHRSMGELNRKLSSTEIIYNKKLRDLQVQRNMLADKVNNKLTTLNTIMTLTGQDYNNAHQEYQDKISNTLQLANLLSNKESKEQTLEEQATDNARANITLITNTLKGQNVDWNTLSAGKKAEYKKMEVQAGMPVGTIQFLSSSEKDPVTSILAKTVGADGKVYFPYSTVGADGVPVIKMIDTGVTERVPSSGGGGGTVADKLKSKISQTYNYFKSKAGPDGYVAPSVYDELYGAWVGSGYDAIDFDTAFEQFKNPSDLGYKN
jgi:hypothetical protein